MKYKFVSNMKLLASTLSLAAIVAPKVCFGADATEAKQGEKRGLGGPKPDNQNAPFHVALWGDMVSSLHKISRQACLYRSLVSCSLFHPQPYVGQTTGVFEQSPGNATWAGNGAWNPGNYYRKFRDCINGADGNTCGTTEPPAFVWGAGDFLSRASPCTPFFYDRFEGLADSFLAPSFFVMGDNEWTDCHKTKTGDPHDPLVQLHYSRSRFFDPNGKNLFGVGTIQTVNGGPYHLEYQMWDYNGITFVGVTVVGSNNGYYDNGPNGKDCPSSLEVFDPGCVRAIAEFHERNATVNTFIQHAFQQANHQAGIMVMIQQTCLVLQIALTKSTLPLDTKGSTALSWNLHLDTRVKLLWSTVILMSFSFVETSRRIVWICLAMATLPMFKS